MKPGFRRRRLRNPVSLKKPGFCPADWNGVRYSFFPQPYFFWNFSTRPAASTYFIFPV